MRGLGYFISIISVVLLGAVAWPGPQEPRWHSVALLAGLALSVGGMGLRWVASKQQGGELRDVERTIGLRQPAE